MTTAGPTAPVRFHCFGQFGLSQDMSHDLRMIGIEEIQGVPTGRPHTRLECLRWLPPSRHGANLPRVPLMRPQAWFMADNAPERHSGMLFACNPDHPLGPWFRCHHRLVANWRIVRYSMAVLWMVKSNRLSGTPNAFAP